MASTTAPKQICGTATYRQLHARRFELQGEAANLVLQRPARVQLTRQVVILIVQHAYPLLHVRGEANM